MQLALNVAPQLLAVFSLEVSKLFDAVLEVLALLVERSELCSLAGFGFGNHAGGGRVTFGDQRVPLLDAFTHVLLVQTTSKLQEIVGAGRVTRVRVRKRRRRNRDGCSNNDGLGCGRRCGEGWLCRCSEARLGLRLRGRALHFGHAEIARDEPLAQLLVFLIQATQLHDNFIQEVVNLVLVVTFAEFGRLKALVDNIFRSKSHWRYLKNFRSAFTQNA